MVGRGGGGRGSVRGVEYWVGKGTVRGGSRGCRQRGCRQRVCGQGVWAEAQSEGVWAEAQSEGGWAEAEGRRHNRRGGGG